MKELHSVGQYIQGFIDAKNIWLYMVVVVID
jgi:hypothetical protein